MHSHRDSPVCPPSPRHEHDISVFIFRTFHVESQSLSDNLPRRIFCPRSAKHLSSSLHRQLSVRFFSLSLSVPRWDYFYPSPTRVLRSARTLAWNPLCLSESERISLSSSNFSVRRIGRSSSDRLACTVLFSRRSSFSRSIVYRSFYSRPRLSPSLIGLGSPEQLCSPYLCRS